jgi:hypothetical protein
VAPLASRSRASSRGGRTLECIYAPGTSGWTADSSGCASPTREGQERPRGAPSTAP